MAFAEGELTQEELEQVPQEDREIVYRLANLYVQLNSVQTMRRLGFGGKEELLTKEGPSIFGYNMDTFEMDQCLRRFFAQLRSQNLLLLRSEFEKLLKEKYFEKGADIGRVLGRDYIERKAHELGLTHVKVPKKTVVLKDDISFEITVDSLLDINAQGVTVYAERIQPVRRDITVEEVGELLRLFEATGYCDIHWGNMIVAADGIYIIDTEFTNFWVQGFYFESGRQYFEMAKIVHALPREQQKPFIDELNAKVKYYQEHEEELNTQQKLQREIELAALKKSGCEKHPCFTFSNAELIPSKLEGVL